MKRRRKSVRRECWNCGGKTDGFRLADGFIRCEHCLTALGNRIPDQSPRLRGEFARRRDRLAARIDSEIVEVDEYSASHPGNPLGHGMPSGETLRLDGESHREAFMRLLRADPCSYCDARISGTVDHIDPRSGSRPMHGLHSWANYAAACESCNQAKRNMSLLLFLARRGIIRKELGSGGRT